MTLVELDPLTDKRVFLVDDQRMFVDALTRIIEDTGMVVDGVATNLQELTQALDARAPDFVLLDYRLPDGDALQALPAVTRAWPDSRVILITGYPSTYTLTGAINAGAAAAIPKTRAASEIVETMRHLVDPSPREPTNRTNLDAPAANLTRRELEVIGLIAEGLTTHQIAARLTISPTTIRNHIQNILRKLNAANQLDAVLKAAKLGLVNITGPSTTT